MTSPLMKCIRFENLEIAEYLLQNGADTNALEHNSTTTAMSIEKMLGNQKTLKLLEEFKKK